MSDMRRIPVSVWSAGVLLIAAAGVVRYAYSGVYWAAINHTWWGLREQLGPLWEFVRDGTRYVGIDPPSGLIVFKDGPIFHLVAYVLEVATPSDRALELSFLVIAHACVLSAFYLLDRTLFSSSRWQVRVLFWGVALNFTPVLYNLGIKNLESWELLCMAIALNLMLHQRPAMRRLAGVPLVLAGLTKVYAGFLLLYLVFRNRVAVMIAAAVAAVTLTFSHWFFGADIGWGYPGRMLTAGFGERSWGGFYWENNSLKGLLNKALIRFELPNETHYFTHLVEPEAAVVVDRVVLVVSLALIGFSMLMLWRWKPSPRLDPLRTLSGFASAAALMFVIAPLLSYDTLTMAVPVYAILLHLAERGLVSRGARIATLVSLVLVGNVMPNSVLVWLLGIDGLNATFNIAPHLSPTEVYKFLGFPGMGAMLLLGAMVAVQWRLVRLDRVPEPEGHALVGHPADATPART